MLNNDSYPSQLALQVPHITMSETCSEWDWFHRMSKLLTNSTILGLIIFSVSTYFIDDVKNGGIEFCGTRTGRDETDNHKFPHRAILFLTAFKIYKNRGKSVHNRKEGGQFLWSKFVAECCLWSQQEIGNKLTVGTCVLLRPCRRKTRLDSFGM